MIGLTSKDKFTVPGRSGDGFVVECPVSCERSLAAFAAAAGTEMEIDGEIRRIIGLEVTAINAPLRKGELIGLLVD